MGGGMTPLLFALSNGAVGTTTALASTTPIMLLILLWIVSGLRPDWRAWIGAILAVGGVLCIVLRAPRDCEMARYLKIRQPKKEDRNLPSSASLLCCREDTGGCVDAN
jgi:hypothetical protein